MLKRFLTLCILLLLPVCAWGETARVMTPGGNLNLRKKPDSRSNIVIALPNQAEVEILDLGEAWSQVSYKGKTGYVKTEYLLRAAQMAGKAVYSDGETVYLLAYPDPAALILLPISPIEAVFVEQVEENWAVVRYGQLRGFVPVSAFSKQSEVAQGKASWIRERGVLAQTALLRLSLGSDAPVLGTLQAGEAVIVTERTETEVLVISTLGCGYLRKEEVLLQGTEGEQSFMPDAQALSAAETALAKAYRNFAREKYYHTLAGFAEKDGFAGPLAQVCFYDETDHYLYSALVEAGTGKTVFTEENMGFAVPVQQELAAKAALPEGQANLTLSAQTLFPGDILEIDVDAWTGHACTYALYRDAKLIFQGKPTPDFRAAYRPREVGNYTLEVAVTDENGLSVQCAQDFTVTEGSTAVSAYQRVYSQKDGTWLQVPYRQSNLDKSGCAIFALSAALQRLGYTGEEVLPANLARRYALCLTDSGTNNERLIREAGQDFGYTYKDKVTDNPSFIVERLEVGALFSFSVARGHIALIDGLSEDRTLVHVVDSAPTATFTRIVGDALYIEKRPGLFVPVKSLSDIPGARYYFETEQYGGLEYYLRVSYASARGVRLIQGGR